MNVLIAILVISSSITLVLGTILPLIELKSFYFFTETPSLFQIVWSLFWDGEYLLSAIFLTFSMIFPLVKQIFVLVEAIGPSGEFDSTRRSVTQKLVPLLTRWSTMDVLLVAIFISAAKISGVASALTQSGLWFYASSALLTTITHYIVSRVKKRVR